MEVPYETPEIPLLLTISLFLYVLNVADALFSSLTNAGLIGPLASGVVFGPQASNILPEYIQASFIVLGYIGILLIVFEAGLSTNIQLLYHNILLSLVVAMVGISLPIAISLLSLSFDFGYSTLQAFGAGAALCSTSLGTTLALLRPDLRQTKTGVVLMSAALLDDIAGLVFAAIIPNLPLEGSHSSGTISWQTIARPILVSFAFATITPILAYTARVLVERTPTLWRNKIYLKEVQLFFTVAMLSGFVAGAHYAGTSELFGSYLAGAFLSHVFSSKPPPQSPPLAIEASMPPPDSQNTLSWYNPEEIFKKYLHPPLQCVFSPIFFASIGVALPIRSLFLVNGSRRVIWRGIVYSLLMVVAKAATGLWVLVWPDPSSGIGWCGRRKCRQESSIEIVNVRTDISRLDSAALIGLAMVPRGEIALIVAQLARPLLTGGTSRDISEPYAVVIWAILVTTVTGALGVGILLKSWDRNFNKMARSRSP